METDTPTDPLAAAPPEAKPAGKPKAAAKPAGKPKAAAKPAPAEPAGDDPDGDEGDEGAADPRDIEIAALKAQVAEIHSMMKAGAVNAVDAVQDRKSKLESEAVDRRLARGLPAIAQDEADRRYPEGRHRYRCVLADGNGHPELTISADNEVDAAARYQAVCGIRSAEKQVSVARA